MADAHGQAVYFGEENHKKGAHIWTGHDNSFSKAVALMEEFRLPAGLLPLEDIVELGFVTATGYFWVVQRNKVEHTFKMIGKLVSYGTQISGFLSSYCINKVSGVKAREFLIWVPVGDISVAEATGKIHFKSIGGLTKVFPVEAFAPGQ